MEGRVFETFQKKCFQNSKIAQNRSQKNPNLFWTCFGANFSKYFMPSVPWRVEFSKTFEKNQKLSIFQESRKSLPKVSKRVLNVFWGNFFEKILPSVPWRPETSKSWKNRKKSQYSEFALNRSQKCPNVFWTCFEVIFSKKKILTSVPWRLETSKSWKKPKKTQYSEFALNRSQKCPKVFWGDFIETFLCPVLHGGSSIRKFSIFFFQNSKRTENRSQNYPNVFWTCFGANFSKKKLTSVPWRLETSKSWKKPKKTQYSEFALNRSQKCPKTFWGDFFEIILCPVLHGGSSFRNFSKKMFSKFQNWPKSFPKNSKPVLNVFWGKFFEIFYAQCSMEGRVFENFRKKPKIFNVPRKPKIVTKSIQTCFERVLG